MHGVLKNYQILCNISNYFFRKTLYVHMICFNLSDDVIDVNDLQNFTVFIKTIVSFAEFKIKLCVYFSFFN